MLIWRSLVLSTDIINDLDGELGEELSSFAREVTEGLHGQEGSHDVAQFEEHESPIMDSVEIKEEHGNAIPHEDRYEDRPASRSESVGSKRSWCSEDDCEENESPSKRQKTSPVDLDEVLPWPFDDEQDSDDFEQQGSPPPSGSDDDFDSEGHQDAITPGPFVQLAAQFGRPAPLIAQTNTADDAWLIDDSDDEEGVNEEVGGRGNLVGTGFVSVNKAGVHVTANELFLHEEDDV